MGGGSADDACEIDLDERSIIFRRPRPAGAGSGSGQRLRMGWPIFQ
jgi:hypothetical protein